MIPIRTLFAPFAIAALVASSAFAANPAAAPPAPVTARHRGGEFKTEGLTRELKIVWHREAKAEIKTLPKEQRKGWLHRKWDAMSEPERRAKVAELQAKWNALPANVRQALLQRKMQRKEAHRMQSDQKGSY